MSRTLIGLVTVAFMILAPDARAAEEILSFNSIVDVQPDASLNVEETITVRAEGRRIKRGIFRDFPVRYQDDGGLYRFVGFKVLEVLRNGEPEDWHTQRVDNVMRVYIGNKDRRVSQGEHTYTLRYRTTRQLRYFKEHDEIYWNATGSFWAFPILSARATIRLPEGADVFQFAGYTGSFGAQGRDFNLVSQNAAETVFETTRRLGRREGFTVAVAFSKGVVPEPGPLKLLIWRLWDNIGFGLLFSGFILGTWYFFRTWQRVGRDPARGTIIPLFSAPEGLSPAAVGYIHFMAFDGAGSSKPFISALMSMASKGWLRILEDGDDMAIERTGKAGVPDAVGEASLYRNLFGSRERFEFKKTNGTTLAAARSLFRQAISREHDGVFFKNNRGAFIAGAAIFVLTLVGFFVLQQPDDDLIGIVFPMIPSAIGGSLLVSLGLRRVLGWIPGGGSKAAGVFFAVLGLVVLVPAILLPFAAPGGIAFAAAITFGAMPAIAVSFFHLMRAPTPLGARIMDEIEGFKLYLSVAEAERMNMLDAPDMSQSVFEQNLPYAVALGVEKPWGKAFEEYLARAEPDPERRSGYHPNWYSGSSWNSGRIGSATAGMVSSMGSSVAGAMPSQSSSGSSGGGSSGGGGGGGGGGGW